MLRSLKITLIFLFLAFNGNTQNYKNSGLKIGLMYEIGQPIHRMGVMFGFHVNRSSFQLSSTNTLFYALRNYGPIIKRWELQTGVNLGIGFGRSSNQQEGLALLAPISNYTNLRNIAVYGIKYYLDPIGTKQFTGAINIRMGNFFLTTENDGLVFLPFDRFRTGALSLGTYFFTNSTITSGLFLEQKVSLNLLLYTGQTQGSPTQKVVDGQYPARFGYKKLNHSKYSTSSHGIFKLNWTSSLPLNQNTFIDIGLDNEHIRNIVQNKFIHDLPFLPKQLIKIKNPHVPMRDTKGGDYLYKKNQAIRKGRIVWGVGLNRLLYF